MRNPIPETVAFHELIDFVITTLDARDPYTYEHSFRVAHYSECLAKKMGLEAPRYQMIHMAAHLHDIGKIGVSDRILRKPGRLEPSEIEEMQSHARIGYNILNRLSLFQQVSTIVLHHHERFDGLGYPHGLKGDGIPLESRIIGIADAFDTITSDRPYRKGMPVAVAVKEINAHSGTQFDPAIVSHFNAIVDQMTGDHHFNFVQTGRFAFAGHEDLMHSRALPL